MKKNGFAFIETIITTVILSASLLYIYHSYNSIIVEEEKRIYYDDVAYIYKTNYIRDFLKEYSNIESIKNSLGENDYIVVLGTENLFTDNDYLKKAYEGIRNNFHVSYMLLVKSSLIDCDFTGNAEACETSLNGLNNYNLKSYINTLNDPSSDYFLVVEYGEMMAINNEIIAPSSCQPGFTTNINDPSKTKCVAYYASLGI